jgi:hypothetical protein
MTRLDLLFVNPYKNAKGDHLLNYAMMWIASYLLQNGKAVRIIDMNRGSIEENHEKLRENLRRYRPRYVAVSGRWWDSWFGTCEIARVTKEFDPSIGLVTGGEQASHFADDVCKHGLFDVVLRGKAELPLLRLLNDEEPPNAVLKRGGLVRRTAQSYFHDQDFLNHTRLSPLHELFDEPNAEIDSVPYVWLGDGCPYNCMYCTQATSAQSDSPNGPGKVRYRSADVVLSDLEEIAKYRTTFFFDFSPTRSPVLEEVVRSLPKRRYGVIWEPWNLRLMEPSFIDTFADAFAYTKYVLDPQVFHHELRKKLASKRFCKPYVSNEHLELLLQKMSDCGNALFTATGAYGLPFEELADVEAGEAYRSSLIERFPALEFSFVLPLMVEPGSPLSKNPEAYSVSLTRRTYEEYFVHSRDVLFRSPVPWFQGILDAVKAYADGSHDTAQRSFNEHCGMYFSEDPSRAIRHMVPSLDNPSSVVRRRPYAADEIVKTISGDVARYRLARNGRELVNFGFIASDIIGEGHRDVEIDLTQCGWLPQVPRSILTPETTYSASYFPAPPALAPLFDAIERGTLRARFLAPEVTETSFLTSAPAARAAELEHVIMPA